MPKSSPQWILAKRPADAVQISDFKKIDAPIPPIDEGSVLVRNIIVSVDPSQRNRLNERGAGYADAVPINSSPPARTIGVIEKSLSPALRAGDLVRFINAYDGSWSTWNVAPAGALQKIPPRGGDLPLEAWLSVLGGPGLAAWFGMDIGKPQKNETVCVTAAAGGVGAVAAQIAKLRGARVIGVARGDAKTQWLRQHAKLDHAIDAQKLNPEQLEQQLLKAAPNGVHLHFENVGGPSLDAGLAALAQNGRIIVCGLIQQYDRNPDLPPEPLRNFGNVISKRASIHGFVLGDFKKRFEEAHKEILDWIKNDKLAWEVDLVEGFDNIPHAFQRLFSGVNLGKTLVRVASNPW